MSSQPPKTSNEDQCEQVHYGVKVEDFGPKRTIKRKFHACFWNSVEKWMRIRNRKEIPYLANKYGRDAQTCGTWKNAN